MIKEPWFHDRRKSKMIMRAKTARSSRRKDREIGISNTLLNRPRLVVLIIIIGVLTALFLKEARLILANNPQFIIERIIIENTNLLSKGAVKDILKLKGDKGFFNVSTKDIARKLEKDPDIGSVTVEKVFPDTLKITINERIPYIRMDIDGKEYSVDYNGVILQRNKSDSSIPKVNGLEITNMLPGDTCTDLELKTLLSLLRAGDSLGWDRFIEPTEIDVYNDGEEVWIYTRERIMIKMKMDNYHGRIKKIITVLRNVMQERKIINTIDIRFKEVYVK